MDVQGGRGLGSHNEGSVNPDPLMLSIIALDDDGTRAAARTYRGADRGTLTT